MRKVSLDSVAVVGSVSGVEADRSRRRLFLRAPDACFSMIMRLFRILLSRSD
jgi:hypothetical protein